MTETGKISVDIAMRGSQTLKFDVTAKADREACFALGVRKSGSSIFSSIVGAIAEFNGVNVIDIPGTAFDAGYRYPDWNGNPRLSDLIWRGNIYIGFRDAPSSLFRDEVFIDAKKILMVRDPRDALVSEYFSNAFSHSVPKGSGDDVISQERSKALEVTVNEYVLKRTRDLDSTVAAFAPLLGDPRLRIHRYEDVIFRKDEWIRQIASHFGLNVSDELITNILGWADQRPADENPSQFVRKVAPGDHLDKLSTATIGQINRQLSPIWRDLGYNLD